MGLGLQSTDRSDFTLTDEQIDACDAIMEFVENRDAGDAFVVHGLAGTGKTVLAAYVASELELHMMAPTGKAASNLRRKTRRNATTIHKIVYNLIDEKVRNRWGRIVTVPSFEGKSLAEVELPYGAAVILDECSMVNEETREDIRRCGLRVIAFGDPGQLPPVSGKQGYPKPDFTLKEIHRQAQDSGIIVAAHAVRHGQPLVPNRDVRMVRDADLTPAELLNFGLVMCWTNKNRHALNAMMRGAAGHTSLLPRAGEPMLALRNKYEIGMYNGAVYQLRQDINPGDTYCVLDVDGTERTMQFAMGSWGQYTCGVKGAETMPLAERPVALDWGYALTVHKAQGSEERNVLLLEDMRRGSEDYPAWAYTALTRASDKITIIRG